METLTPDEFFERVGVRVPDSVIRNLEAHDRAIWWVTGTPYLPLTAELVEDACIPGDRLGILEEDGTSNNRGDRMGRMKELGMEEQQAAESKERFERGDKVWLCWTENIEPQEAVYVRGPSGPGDTFVVRTDGRLFYVNGNASTFEGLIEPPTA